MILTYYGNLLSLAEQVYTKVMHHIIIYAHRKFWDWV